MTEKYYYFKAVALILFISLTSCGQQTSNSKVGIVDEPLNTENSTDWKEVKKTAKVYPPNSIAVLMLKTNSGKPGTAWVDKGYDKYPYKRFCPYNFLIMVDLTDNIAKSNPNLDMGAIEDFFIDELRKVCVAHIVARVVTDKGMNLEMYLEFKEPTMTHLQTILNNPNRPVSFNYEVTDDPNWEAVSGLMEL